MKGSSNPYRPWEVHEGTVNERGVMRRKRGLAGLASVGAVLLIGALAPSAAMAHPCISSVESSLGKTLTLHTGGNWAGYMPSFADLEHECADDLNSYIY